MKFNCLVENDDMQLSPKSQTVIDNINLIRQDCKEFLKHENRLLFRGMHRDTKTLIGSYNIRQDRTPKDTILKFHEVIDEIFYDLFGEKLRSGALFCSRAHDATFVYGITRAIFPKGNYMLYSSPHIEDMYFNVSTRPIAVFLEQHGTAEQIAHMIAKQPADEETITAVLDTIWYWGMGDFFADAYDNIHYALHKTVAQVEAYIRQVLKEFIKQNYGYDTGAVSSELMLISHDPNKLYYAVNLGQIKAIISPENYNSIYHGLIIKSPKVFLDTIEHAIRTQYNDLP